MDNLDRIKEIMQCIVRLWYACPVHHCSVEDDLQTIADNIQIVKKELLESEPVRRGRWEKHKDFLDYCTICGAVMSIPHHKFCGNCGTKMVD